MNVPTSWRGRDPGEWRVGDLVQPIECRAVLLGEVGRNPDDGHSLQPRSVGQYLAKMVMVCPFYSYALALFCET